MANLTRETIQNLTKLCRIHCTPDEEERLLTDLGKILSYIDQLNEVDTGDLKPCYQVLESVTNVTRPDEVGETLPRDVFLANAPAHVGGMVRVPPVIQQQ